MACWQHVRVISFALMQAGLALKDDMDDAQDRPAVARR
jgi:hypothetical protein